MKINLTLIIGIILLFCLETNAQVVGGRHVYEFLDAPSSARITALGGNLITVQDDDIALAYANPAALNEQMHQQLSFNYNFHLADIHNGYVGYGHHIEKWKTTIHGGVQYINYGEFEETNALGDIIGTFEAAEYAFTIGAGRKLYDKMTLGANFKFVSSNLESYSSIGLAADASAMYRDTASRFTATLVFRNIGGQFTNYRQDNREPIPFDIQFGVSKKLKHLPFRLSIIAHNLQRWNILYDDPNLEQTTIFTGDNISTENQFGDWVDNLFRHVIFNGEFLLGKKENLRLRVGYNHLRRQELTVAGLRSTAGFSFGFGIKIKTFRLDYGSGSYHLAGGTSHLTISTPLSFFSSRKKVKGF